MKTFFIKTLGCKVNQCDSEELRQFFHSCGWMETHDQKLADIRIVNTCCVTQTAERKSRQTVRQIASAGPCAVFGCYSQYGKTVLQNIEGVSIYDFIQKNDFFRHPAFSAAKAGHENTTKFSGRTRAFLKVQDGCDNQCSYCIVPLLRGRSRSLPVRNILLQAQRWGDSGHKEIVLTGVNLGSFGRDLDPRMDITDLICELESIAGLERIRLSSIEAQDVTKRLLEKMNSSSKLCAHLHIPFQSGADAVLSAMNRCLRVSDYQRIVEAARKALPDLVITCDFIAGFPTETDEDFKQTLSFLKWVRPLKTHVFPFSRRKGTQASQYDELSPRIVRERVDTMKQCAYVLSEACRKDRIGKFLDVLFEGREGNVWTGHSCEYIKAECPSSLKNLRNQIRKIKVLGVRNESVFGEIQEAGNSVSFS